MTKNEKENIELLIQTSEFTELQRIGTELEAEKKRFDLLSVFKNLIDENAWSRLFAYLFDSTKEHGLKQKALREWLQCESKSNDFIKSFLAKLPCEQNSESITITEWRTEPGRRLDIYIEIKDTLSHSTAGIIGIENKVNSGEQIEQVSHYQEEIIKRFPKVPNKLIFFLTPDGRKSLTSYSTKDCPCVPYSYQSIIDVCDKLKPEANDASTFLSVLRNHISKLINYNEMEEEIRSKIHKLYENKKYREAIKLIGQYAPNIRYVFEELHEKFKKVKELNIRVKEYNCDKEGSGPFITKETCQFQLYFDDFEGVDKNGYSPRYILNSYEKNPDVGNRLVVQLMLRDEDRKDEGSRVELRKKALKSVKFPESRSDLKNWDFYINIWESESYTLKDLGPKDIEGLTKLICKSINETYDPLKIALKKL